MSNCNHEMASLNFGPRYCRRLVTLYTTDTLLAGMSAMIVPAAPVLAVAFEISPGTAARITSDLDDSFVYR